MFFVFFPIDVVLLDSKKRIVAIKENFMPFTFYAPKVAFRYAIELTAGIIRKNHLKHGDSLIFEASPKTI